MSRPALIFDTSSVRLPGERRVLGVALVDEGAGNAAGAGIEVLVRAPAGKVDIPLVQAERNIANGVRKVKSNGRTDLVRRLGDGGNVKELTGVVLDAGRDDDGDRGTILLAGAVERRRRE